MRKPTAGGMPLTAKRSAVAAGVAAVVLAGSGTAYACTDVDASRAVFTPHVFTAPEVAALKAEMASDFAAIRAAKAAELAAIKAHDRAAALAAAKAAAAAKAKLRADLEAALAKARAEAKARAAARAAAAAKARADVEGANFRFSDPGRHHCDGDHDGWSGDHDGWYGGLHR